MNEEIKLSELPDFDIAQYLDTPEAMAAYLTVVLEERDEAAVVDALRTMARVRAGQDAVDFVADLAAALQDGASLSFEMFVKACAVLGLRPVFQSM